MDHIFQINGLDTQGLQPQVCQALNRRAEQISRVRHPRLWKRADRINAGRSREEIEKRQRLRSRIFSLCVIVLGVVLFVPGLLRPKELMIPLMAGGAGVVVGAFTLVAGTRRRRDPFEQSAKALLEGMASIVPAKVVFTGERMTVTANGTEETVSYDAFAYVVEQPELFLVTFGMQSVIVLPKKDLDGSVEDFTAFIREKATLV